MLASPCGDFELFRLRLYGSLIYSCRAQGALYALRSGYFAVAFLADNYSVKYSSATQLIGRCRECAVYFMICAAINFISSDYSPAVAFIYFLDYDAVAAAGHYNKKPISRYERSGFLILLAYYVNAILRLIFLDTIYRADVRQRSAPGFSGQPILRDSAAASR